MCRFTRVSVLTGALFAMFVGAAFADLRFSPPKKKDKAPTYTLEVKVGNGNRITLPRGVIKTTAANEKTSIEARTVVAGVALSMALISFVFIRPKKGRSLLIAALLVGIVTVGVAQMAFADIRVPRNRKPKTNTVTVETARRGNKITITLDRETLRQLNQQNGKTSSEPTSPTARPKRE